MFGETDYDPGRQYNSVSFEEQLDALGRAVDAGKVGNHIIKSPLAIICTKSRLHNCRF